MSIVLRLNSDLAIGSSNDFTTSYTENFECSDWEIALHSATLYYSWANISSAKNNNIIRYSTDNFETVEPDIVVPEGIYSLTNLNDFISSQLFLRGQYTGAVDEPVYSLQILPNLNTLRAVVVLSGSYQLDMTVGLLYQF